MNLHEWIGFAAGALTTSAFAPQALMILRTRRVADISLAMYASFVSGVGLWVLYGFEINSMAVIVTNSITFLLAGSVLFLKLSLGKEQ